MDPERQWISRLEPETPVEPEELDESPLRGSVSRIRAGGADRPSPTAELGQGLTAQRAACSIALTASRSRRFALANRPFARRNDRFARTRRPFVRARTPRMSHSRAPSMRGGIAAAWSCRSRRRSWTVARAPRPPRRCSPRSAHVAACGSAVARSAAGIRSWPSARTPGASHARAARTVRRGSGLPRAATCHRPEPPAIPLSAGPRRLLPARLREAHPAITQMR